MTYEDKLYLYNEFSKKSDKYKGIQDITNKLNELQVKPLNNFDKTYLIKLSNENNLKVSKKILKTSSIKENTYNYPEEYYKIKYTFEQLYFLVETPLSICKETENGLLMYGTKEVNDLFKIHFWINEDKKQFFYNEWLTDNNRRTYNKIVFEPNLNIICNGDYNLFSGFKNDVDKIEPQDINNIMNLINYICQYDEKTINFVLDYIAHIIQFPHIKTGMAIVFYSTIHGVGKNSLIELILKLLDNKYTTKINTIEDLTHNFNSQMENKLFCYGDEIKARKTDLYNELKDVITRERLNIERKGKDKYMINDYCNYIFTTNEYNNMKIEKSDRRFVLIECPEYTKDKEFYNKYYEDINNEDIIKYFFKILKERKIKVKLDILETDYKKDIMATYINSTEKYLYTNGYFIKDKFINNDDLYNNIKTFESENKYHSHLTSKRDMSFKIKNIFGDITMRTSTQRGYKFPINISEVLEKYNKEYYEAYYTNNTINIIEEN
jgi:hypothetical protein